MDRWLIEKQLSLYVYISAYLYNLYRKQIFLHLIPLQWRAIRSCYSKDHLENGI